MFTPIFSKVSSLKGDTLPMCDSAQLLISDEEMIDLDIISEMSMKEVLELTRDLSLSPAQSPIQPLIQKPNHFGKHANDLFSKKPALIVEIPKISSTTAVDVAASLLGRWISYLPQCETLTPILRAIGIPTVRIKMLNKCAPKLVCTMSYNRNTPMLQIRTLLPLGVKKDFHWRLDGESWAMVDSDSPDKWTAITYVSDEGGIKKLVLDRWGPRGFTRESRRLIAAISRSPKPRNSAEITKDIDHLDKMEITYELWSPPFHPNHGDQPTHRVRRICTRLSD